MWRILATFVLLATTMAPAAAIEAPEVRAAVMCPPVTISDLLPPEAEPPPDEAPTDSDAPIEEDPPAEQPPVQDPPAEDPPADPPPACDTPFVYRMGSPFAQNISVFSSFGAPRPEDRLHAGIDIAMPKMTPVFAVADGTISWVSEECCNVAVRHRDGWSSYYIHLNNDTFGTDDGLGVGVAPGIEEGLRVERGQLLGWVGDSGNAEPTEAHLHFELRMPNGVSIDAAPSLRRADELELPPLPVQPEPAEDGSAAPIERFPREFTGPFVDDDGHPDENILNLLASWGLLAPCDKSGVRICPDDIPTGFQWAAMLDRAGFEPPERPGVYARTSLKDPSSTLHDGVAVRGCGVRRYCPDQPISIVEAEGSLQRSTAPVWLPPVIDTIDCDAFDADAVTRSALLLRVAIELGIVIEPPCEFID